MWHINRIWYNDSYGTLVHALFKIYSDERNYTHIGHIVECGMLYKKKKT